MNLKYDIHLSAYQISKVTIAKFEELGFQRDEFANNTRCEVTAYHATYRGIEKLPSKRLWKELCNNLQNDAIFSGGLEEEEFDGDNIIFLSGNGIEIKELLPAMKTEQPPPNIYKACDIHINVDIENSNSQCLKYLETLEIPSFDKSKDGKIHRIFTITTETLEDGEKAFTILSDYFKNFKGLKGKMKLEKTLQFFRKPANAYTLPLISKKAFKEWLSKLETAYAK